MAADLICDVCGEANPPTAQFCGACNAFLSWDGTTDADRTRVIKVLPEPSTPIRSPHPPDTDPESDADPPSHHDRRSDLGGGDRAGVGRRDRPTARLGD